MGRTPTYLQTKVSQIGDHGLSTSCGVAERPDRHCGDNLVLSKVRVLRRTWDKLMSHEISVVLDLDYQLFAQLVEWRIDVATRLGAVFGDGRDPISQVVVIGISPGSVVYTWTNSSVLIQHRTVCPIEVHSVRPLNR